MELFPAIDLFGGRAVRLLHGDYSQMTVYSDRPQDVAADFAACGARHIHLVDLEGARDGGTPNLSVIEAIAAKTALDIEVGGGIRSEETVKRVLGAGVGRTILGTAAAGDPDFLARMVARYGEAIAVSVDLRDERLDEHLDYCNERSDYNYISGDSDLLGNHLFERRNGDVRAHKDYRSCDAHAQRTLDRGRNRERRAGAEHQTENGVLNENALGKLLKKTLFLCHFLLRPL